MTVFIFASKDKKCLCPTGWTISPFFLFLWSFQFIRFILKNLKKTFNLNVTRYLSIPHGMWVFLIMLQIMQLWLCLPVNTHKFHS